MGGVIEEVVRIKFQHPVRGEIIVKKLSAHIDGIAKIQAVIPEVQQADLFFKGEGGGGLTVVGGTGAVLQKPVSLLIGGVGGFRIREAAKADMLSAVGQGGAVIDLAVFFDGGENTCIMGLVLAGSLGSF